MVMEHFKDVHVCGESLPEDDSHGATGVNCKDDGVKSLHLAQQTPTVAKSEKRRLQNRKAQKIYRLKQKQRVQELESLVGSQTTTRQDSDVNYYTPSLDGNDEALATLCTAEAVSNVVPPGLVQNQGADVDGFSQSIVNCYHSGQRFVHDAQPCAQPEGQSILSHPPDTSEPTFSRNFSPVAAHLFDDAGGGLPAQSFRQTLALSQDLVHDIREKGAALSDVLALGL
ncbi:hypothetical protein J3459_016697 [Metarhizium acridum]|uniref:BZIP domain-containing protein n=1 Tax=Metarhizium acridum (strain CQMa 102) TaxID=655827 RepID=E9EHG9_METAQ|nr:uncharacterized protein MAC_09317 [Metarhizium acridum CQMa 102]EFY84652.1 hypothetical protein MAC_09317 [Metarhizium acridum CQMa 102]KAG8404890.1 hypothetical protein J3459_016697 [Metarhizium acridum]KAG8410806.1 hypothetical protein J3458_016895 [Metarhizium acridum]